MKKRIISLILALCLVFTMMPASVNADEPATVSGTCGENVTWVLTEDGELTISGAGAMTDYSSEEDVPWYPYISMIEAVIIEFGVTTIGNYAFCGYDALTSVTIPNSITDIGRAAFYDCDDLTSVTIPDSVTSIIDSAFQDCDSLTSVVIPDSVTTVDGYTFHHCDSLTSVTIGESVISIRGYAFAFCRSLTSVVIPDSVTTIGDDVFFYCDSLTDVTIGNSVTSIGHSAFESCSSLASVVIPNSVTFLDEEVFRYCSDLSDIRFLGDAPTIGTDAFSDVTANAYYLESNDTWTASTKQNYGGTLTWIPYTGEGHKHSYSAMVTAPTCTENGYTTYTCECGDTYTADKIPALGHTEVIDEAIPATCTTDGKTKGSHCSVCGEILVEQNIVAATGHTEVIDEAIPATCTTDGKTAGSHCSVCNEVLTAQEVILATGHKEVIDEGIPATCTEVGLTEGSHCSVCNEIIVAQVVIEAIGHRYSEGICEICGSKDPDYTEPEENNDVLIISDQQTISNQTINSDVYITSTGRATFNNVIVNGDIYCHGQLTANDCTANDVYAYAYGSMLTCDAFDGTHGLITGSLTCNTLTITDDALDYAFAKWGKGTDAPPEDHVHQYTTVVTAPTCTTGGYTTYTCECGNSYIDDEVPALGHNEVVDAAVAATCTESGLTEGVHCSICGEVIAAQNVVPATGHTEVIDEAVPATCTTEGKTQGSHCSICNTVIVSQNTVAATGHTEVIDKAVDATCTEDGLTEGTHCSVCSTVIIVQKVVEATGHTFTDGFCEICGSEDPDYVQPTEPSVPEETDPSEPEETKPTDPDVTEPSEPEESEPTVPSEPEDPTTPSEPEEHTHVYGEWVRVKDPTSNEEGLEERICACGQSELRIIDKLTNPFSDVKKGDYFYEPVLWAANKGITSGMSATSFGPNLSCTRGHIVTFLWRAAGEPEPATTVNPFNDVKESAFYYKAVLWAVENGITTGMKEGEFWPNYTCNRAQAVTFLYRAAGEPEIQSNANPFSDVKGDAYYRNAVLWAVENNVTNGMGNGKFEPNYTCTRGQIVTFLYRSFSK